MNKCEKCGSKLNENDLFCQVCGNKNEKESILLCPNCGTSVEEDDVFCKNCRAELQRQANSTEHIIENVIDSKLDAIKVCPSCSEKNASGSLFCEKCGASLQTEPQKNNEQNNEEVNQKTEEFSDSYSTDPVQPTDPIQPYLKTKTDAKNKKKTIVIFSVIGATVFAMVLALLLFFVVLKDPVIATWKLYSIVDSDAETTQIDIEELYELGDSDFLTAIKINRNGTAELALQSFENQNMMLKWSKKKKQDFISKDPDHIEYLFIYTDSFISKSYTMIYNKRTKKIAIESDQETGYYEKTSSKKLNAAKNSGEKQETTTEKTTTAETTTTAAPATDYNKYVGDWISSDASSTSQVENSGGYLMKIKSIDEKNINFDLSCVSGSARIANISGTFPIKDNKSEFTFDEDGWGNKGKGTITLNGDVIGLTINTTYKDPSANWDMGSGTTMKKASVSEPAGSNDLSEVIVQGKNRYYSKDELRKYSKADLNLLRNGMFALEGRQFNTKEIQEFFSKQSWYHPNSLSDDQITGRFNSYQKENLKLIMEVEKEK